MSTKVAFGSMTFLASLTVGFAFVIGLGQGSMIEPTPSPSVTRYTETPVMNETIAHAIWVGEIK